MIWSPIIRLAPNYPSSPERSARIDRQYKHIAFFDMSSTTVYVGRPVRPLFLSSHRQLTQPHHRRNEMINEVMYYLCLTSLSLVIVYLSSAPQTTIRRHSDSRALARHCPALCYAVSVLHTYQSDKRLGHRRTATCNPSQHPTYNNMKCTVLL